MGFMKFLKIKDLMARYGISRFAVYQYIEQGILPAGVKIGSSRRFELSELEKYEANFLKA